MSQATGIRGPAVGVTPKPWGIPAVLAGLALPLAIWGGSLAITIAEGGQGDLTDAEIATALVFTIILDVILVGIAAWLSIGRHRLPAQELGLRAFDPKTWWLPIALATAAHVAIIIYGIVLTLVQAEGAIPEQEDIENFFDSRTILPLAGTATVIFAPLAEEIFFRGFIFGGLLRPLGVGCAMFASGLIFSLFHVSDAGTLGLIVPFTGIGMLLAWVYWRTGSLWPSIATHFLFNLVSFVILAASAGLD